MYERERERERERELKFYKNGPNHTYTWAIL